MTALHGAVYSGDVKTVEVIMQHCQGLDDASNDGNSFGIVEEDHAKLWQMCNALNDEGQTPHEVASSKKDLDVLAVLDELGDPNAEVDLCNLLRLKCVGLCALIMSSFKRSSDGVKGGSGGGGKAYIATTNVTNEAELPPTVPSWNEPAVQSAVADSNTL
jgi:hypothetical protein